MSDQSIRIKNRLVTAPADCIEAMRKRLNAVPLIEKAEIAYRASTMLRQALADHQLTPPLRGDVEDAIAMLLVLGVAVVDGSD
ncbi:MAG TPA: hypothetical protein VMB81_04060 [Candidatus Sulfotelmatobacter sp.]|nr:hypothetical protein [Candidatus Sulfotelmatobacter sp.]